LDDFTVFEMVFSIYSRQVWYNMGRSDKKWKERKRKLCKMRKGDAMLLAGLDIGTTGCKVAVYSEGGEFLGTAYRDYPVQRLDTGHEVDASAIWQGVRQVIREAAQRFPGIGGLGVTSFGETFVLLDGQDQPLLPAMLYTDPRGQEACDYLRGLLGEETIVKTTGISPSPMYGLPKMMWVKQNRPDIWQKVKRICQMEDYIVYLLTGNAQIDYSLATRTMAFDIHGLKWSDALLEAAGVEKALLSRPVPTGTKAGCIRPDLAAELGFSPETQVVSVSHDQVAAAIGSGVFDESCSVDGAGTVECITPVFDEYDPMKMAAGGYAVIPYVVPGKYVCYAFSFTGGALVDWYIKNLAGYAKAESLETGKKIYGILERGWDNKPTQLLVLPHFAGAATPYMDGGSKGAIVGLTVETTQQEIYQACMEGVCYERRLNLEKLRQGGVDVKALRATGGGARSRVWMQMKADILNMPVTALQSEEAGAAGSAMLVGIACGVFRDLQEAAEVMVTTKETYYPRPEVCREYDAVFRRYEKLYEAVRPLV